MENRICFFLVNELGIGGTCRRFPIWWLHGLTISDRDVQGSLQSGDYIDRRAFCGLQITNRGDNIDVTAKNSVDLTEAVVNGVYLEAELTKEGER